MRRRRTLSALVLAAVVVSVFTVLGIVPWWGVTIPAGLVVVFLLVSAVAVHRASRFTPVRIPEPLAAPIEEIPRRADMDVYTAATSAGLPVIGQTAAETFPSRPTVDDLWDPVSMPLPTYVNKAKATPIIRTIDLGQPATSGKVLLSPSDRSAESVPGHEATEATG